MRKQCNIAFIGCGSIAREHAAALRAIDSSNARIKLVSCSDTISERAEEIKTAFDFEKTVGSSRDIFEDESIDAVYICTHTNSHRDLCIDAARAQKHIFVEKPLALTVRECIEIEDAVNQSNVLLMTGFKLRFYPMVENARQFIPKPIMSIAQISDERWAENFWANDPLLGGGNVLSQGCHAVDLLCHLHGSNPVRIYAEGGNFTHHSLDIVDTLCATIAFANGSISSVSIADAGSAPHVSKFSFQLFDGVRTAHLHDRLMALTLHDADGTRQLKSLSELGIIEENRAFIHALTTGTQPPATVRDGLRATLMIRKAYDALRTGQPQVIKL